MALYEILQTRDGSYLGVAIGRQEASLALSLEISRRRGLLLGTSRGTVTLAAKGPLVWLLARIDFYPWEHLLVVVHGHLRLRDEVLDAVLWSLYSADPLVSQVTPLGAGYSPRERPDAASRAVELLKAVAVFRQKLQLC